MPARPCRSGRTTTTPSDRTAASAISRQRLTPNSALPTRNGTGRCATPRAPRPVPLLHRAKWAQINPGLRSSLDVPVECISTPSRHEQNCVKFQRRWPSIGALLKPSAAEFRIGSTPASDNGADLETGERFIIFILLYYISITNLNLFSSSILSHIYKFYFLIYSQQALLHLSISTLIFQANPYDRLAVLPPTLRREMPAAGRDPISGSPIFSALVHPKINGPTCTETTLTVFVPLLFFPLLPFILRSYQH